MEGTVAIEHNYNQTISTSPLNTFFEDIFFFIYYFFYINLQVISHLISFSAGVLLGVEYISGVAGLQD